MPENTKEFKNGGVVPRGFIAPIKYTEELSRFLEGFWNSRTVKEITRILNEKR